MCILYQKHSKQLLKTKLCESINFCIFIYMRVYIIFAQQTI